MAIWRGWTAELDKTAIDMWTAGYSASFIASALGCTRNAVIGKMTRGKVAGGSCINRPPDMSKFEAPEQISNAEAKATKGKTSEHPKPATMPTGQCSEAELRVGGSGAAHRPMDEGSVTSAPLAAFESVGPHMPVAFFDLADWGACRWPIAGLYCGAPCERRASYCKCHRALSVGTGTYGERTALKAPRISALTGAF